MTVAKTTVDLNRILGQAAPAGARERIGMMPDVKSTRTKKLRGRIAGGKPVVSLCPYLSLIHI